MADTYNFYFAGGLFSHKDLIGNTFLADAIERCSQGKFKCVLPQNIEFRNTDAQSIRDDDIVTLINCDLAIFNYDGTELDSGTVVEYMFAKFADIPTLILRTDFRNGGDCTYTEKPLPWNLMSSFYPRTETCVLSSADIYRESGKDCVKMVDAIATQIVPLLEKLLTTSPTMTTSEQPIIYDWLSRMPNFNSNRADEIKKALERKQNRGLL